MTAAPTGLALVLLHFFGSSSREWDAIREALPVDRRVLAFDMPGFGERQALGAMDVAAMVDYVDGCITDAGLTECVVVGHSMSGKVARVLAAREPAYLRGLILVTPSPPSPEPFDPDGLKGLLAFDGSERAAARYVDGVTASRLPAGLRDVAIGDAMRASPAAWNAWLAAGSQEDWSGRVGLLAMPTLVVAASVDATLGETAQRALTMPHLARGTLVVVEGGHALPYDNPAALLDVMSRYVDRLERSTRHQHHPTMEEHR